MATVLDSIKRLWLGLASGSSGAPDVDEVRDEGGVAEGDRRVFSAEGSRTTALRADAGTAVKVRPDKQRASRQASSSSGARVRKRLELNESELLRLLRATPKFGRARPARGEDPESRANDGYRLLDSLRDNVGGMLLLTATPMQLHDFELYSMIDLVEPGLFGGYSDFAASREEIASINRAVTALRSPRPSRQSIEDAERLLKKYAAPAGLRRALVTKSGRVAAAEWLSRCHRLAHALVRNRKVEVGGFTSRIAHRIEVTPTQAELELQADLLDFIRTRYGSATPRKRTAVGLVLVAFEKMLCSSSNALAASLETRSKRLQGELDESGFERASDDPDLADEEGHLYELPAEDVAEEIATLTALARRARRLNDTKLAAVEELVDRILEQDPSEKILIFSQYLNSIEMIRARLAGRHSVRVFHGGMTRDEKDAAHEVFRRSAQVLISSEAGGEGRNFQFCHIVVNYDLPWNPMKIEQRIGRVDRVGQTRDVEIYNFAVRGMLDERILDVLEHRIQLFTETVGALDPILESFEEEVGRIALGERGDAEAAFARLGENLEDEIRKAEALEELRRDFVLDWRSFQRERASRMLGRTPRATRADLERFCRAAIARFPVGGIEPHPEGGLEISVPGVLRQLQNGVEEDYKGTFDVTEALVDERQHFFAMGHPLVEAILDNVGDPWWAPVGVLESPEWARDEPALLVDYRLELYGIRDSGRLITHLVSEDGVQPPVEVLRPSDPRSDVRLPQLPEDVVQRYEKRSVDAARREARTHFEEFKAEHASFLEQEIERLARMFDSRAGLLNDRIARNTRQIDQLDRFGTERQRSIIPALEGQVSADQTRVAELESERQERLTQLHKTLPSHYLRTLGVTYIVRPGKLEELRV